MTLKERVEKIFKRFNLHYDCDYNNNAQQVIVSVSNGDWKHDHLYLKIVMNQNGFILEDEYIGSSDSDCYDAEYTFKLN